jgi:hypothetical protein
MILAPIGIIFKDPPLIPGGSWIHSPESTRERIGKGPKIDMQKDSERFQHTVDLL